jgi:hypothetical protein
MCVAYDENSDIFVSTNPAAAQPRWIRTRLGLPRDGINDIACPSPGTCVLNSERGILITTDVAAGRWIKSPATFVGGETSIRGNIYSAPFAQVNGSGCSTQVPCSIVITKATIKNRSATFAFHASPHARAYRCALLRGSAKLDPARASLLSYRPCESPKTYRRMKKGTYLFAVASAAPSATVSAPTTRAIAIGEPAPSIAQGPAPRGIGTTGSG